MAGSRLADVTAAAITALRADTGVLALLGSAKVYSYVPEDTGSPYCWVVGGAEALWADSMRNHDGRTVDIEVECWSAYRGAKEVDDLADAVVTCLAADASWSGVSSYTGSQFVRCDRLTTQLIESREWFMRRVVVRVWLGTS